MGKSEEALNVLNLLYSSDDPEFVVAREECHQSVSQVR